MTDWFKHTRKPMPAHRELINPSGILCTAEPPARQDLRALVLQLRVLSTGPELSPISQPSSPFTPTQRWLLDICSCHLSRLRRVDMTLGALIPSDQASFQHISTSIKGGMWTGKNKRERMERKWFSGISRTLGYFVRWNKWKWTTTKSGIIFDWNNI